MAARSQHGKSGKSPCAHVALLRGINVGGKNMLPMARLVELFERAGCGDVRAYIQSGNVVFSATPAGAERAGRAVCEAITAKFGFQARVVMRTADELDRVVAGNPFMNAGTDPKTLYVGFLGDAPVQARIAALDPERSPGDSFRVIGRDVFMRLFTGAAKTKLTNAWFDSALGTTSTFRNWRTVLKLAEMARGTG